MVYLKDLRVSDLETSARDIYDLTLGLRGIRDTADRGGHERLMSEAARWIAAAEALRDDILTSLESERSSNV
ncbi:hypothetical protein [Sphingomonas phyllosphaerae]|uniref:hypothetical protein n=1 Tax=Sphingomonas phyllosphaerae TaxID=257003 RepID=UPI0012DE5DD4|nr:hypothetical protein [Sphingomonas phyllosphaerae]